MSVGGEPVERDRDLAAGDRIELPGLTLRVVAGDDPAPAMPASSWVVRGRGTVFGVVRTPFTVGGSADADLRIDGWPDVAFRFHLATQLHLEALVPLTLDGRALRAGEIEGLDPGAVVECEGQRFEVIAGGSFGLDSTAGGRRRPAATRIHLAFLARGGRLTVHIGGRERAVYLPERRCDLVATLLRPPPPFAPGDFIPDDVVLPRIWGGRVMTRVDLNVLLHRARQDLVRAELDGGVFLQRADGGTATRFTLDPGTQISVE